MLRIINAVARCFGYQVLRVYRFDTSGPWVTPTGATLPSVTPVVVGGGAAMDFSASGGSGGIAGILACCGGGGSDA